MPHQSYMLCQSYITLCFCPFSYPPTAITFSFRIIQIIHLPTPTVHFPPSSTTAQSPPSISTPLMLSLSLSTLIMESANNVNVQHVNKKSSDELLRKFAEDEAPPKKELMLSKRRKRSSSATARGRVGGGDQCDSPSNSRNGNTSNGSHSSLVERRSLLPSATRKSALLRQLGIHGRSHLRLRARDIKNKSVIGTIEKTWRRTIEGASKLFVEKHYNRHKRLINDMI